MTLFHYEFVYPCDEVGPYVTLSGTIIEIEDHVEGKPVLMTVETTEGVFKAVWDHHPPKVGCRATIRVYNAGGGFYPDNRVVSWSV